MKIAVTGCNGRVGRRVVLWALKGDHAVVGVDHILAEDTEFRDNPSFSFIKAELKDFDEALKAFEGCDAIIQLASVSHPVDYKTNTHNSNVVITWNVLRAAAELGIVRIAQASSVNVLRGVFSTEPRFEYFPIDENHPCLPDEPYGLSKLIAEMQAETIIRRYPSIRVASIRLHWSVPTRTRAYRQNMERARGDLWSYVQEDASADAFVRAVTTDMETWSGHEPFFIVAPQIAADQDWLELKEKYFQDVPVRPGWKEGGAKGFFDCTKAERLLGWVHRDYA
ncbi:NAD(P)-binding protein [Leucogyrophana mollusca]|uniref:NAD(P)-binding protein n=1 Tax=Leucogyrophana mollusca TaxID=85980 RepID=A0ACB8BRI4_9AGAM|nr:NAD(P)-binding protein [Leucogyrophana mollusca]